jgi:probable rRNA maturation factor
MTDGPIPKPQGGPRVLVSNRQTRPVDGPALAELAARTLTREGAGAVELSLSFVEAREMEDLHVRFMGEPGPTDVLSFPMDEDGLVGDVVICPEEAARNNPNAPEEMRLLVVHGVLHLLGYDHEGEEERRVMWAKQRSYSGVAAS